MYYPQSASAVSGQQLDAALGEPNALAAPKVVVARAGSYVVTGAMLDELSEATLSGAPASERLVPPQFSACIAHAQAEAAALGQPAPAPAQIKIECAKGYQAVLQTTLEHLIEDEWLIGGARELGSPVAGEAGGASSVTTLEKRANLATNAIQQAIKRRVPSPTNAQITSYYEQHRLEYLLGGERDLRIARTKTQGEAAKVKSEIESGKSFASVVRELPAPQAANSSEGSALNVQPHRYGEPNLNEAIFSATPGVLVGPLATTSGYFVFEVTTVRSEHVRPLAEVGPVIRQRFAGPLEEQALAAFNKRWTATWTAKTNCSPGYVVPKCRQFKGAPASASGAAKLG